MTNDPSTRTPEAVVSAAFVAMNTEDWHGVAALCDPQGLRIFKNRTLNILDMLNSDCDSPGDLPDIASANSYDHDSDFQSHLRLEVAGVSSIDEVRAMDPGKLFTRWVQAKSFRPRNGDHDAADEPVKGEKTVWSYTYLVLGSVRDGDGIAHVVIGSPRADSVTVDHTDDGVQLSPDLEEYLTALNHWGEPLFITCCLQPDGSWRMIPRRNLFLFDSITSVPAQGSI
jgi:hypothetical protein